jgi:hypothetical protein
VVVLELPVILGDASIMTKQPSEVPGIAPPTDQQPIQRIVGKRISPPIGQLPSPEARAAMAANARYYTRAPKGIFFYQNHEEMNRDRERWTIAAILARQAERG